MMAPDLILATDLDGTFLGGTPAQREDLYTTLINSNGHLLIFVTGRDPDFIRGLVAEPGMPRPDLIIGDIGTSVLDGATFQPIEALEEEIAARWNNAGEHVAALLDNEPGLRPQPTRFRYRRSYYYDPEQLRPETLRKVEAAGFDWLLSADTYLDVLPRGISKGPTLLRLLGHLGLPEDRVLVAGDTLNDRSLFETGLKGVVVENAEAALRDSVASLPNVYFSSHPGAAGIADALQHFEFRIEKKAPH